MGMLGSALLGGLAGLGKGITDVAKMTYEDQLEAGKEQRRAEIAKQIEIEREARIEERRVNQANDIESRAAKIAGSRKVASDEVNAEGDAAATAYAQAEAEGRIDSAGAKKGMLAASDYVNQNAKPDTNVTQDDRTQAAIQAGYITPKDAAAITDKEAKREMAAALAQGKWENALQIAQMKGDFAMMLGELKAASAAGNEKATEMMRNWKFLESQGYSKEEIAAKLTEGKVGEYTTIETEKDNMDGSKTKTTQKVKSGSSPAKPAGAHTQFVLKDGKLVPAPAK